MYCIKCGVELSEGQRSCPICKTKVYHPDFLKDDSELTYPIGEFKSEEFNRKGILFVATIVLLLVSVLAIIFDLSLSGGIFWSGYVAGGLLLSYIVALLPLWFKNPNPVIFVPCSFVAAGVYLLYICLHTGGHWYMSLAFPITLSLGIFITTLVTLLRYLKKGRLYIYGGFLIALGIWCALIEFFIHLSFPGIIFLHWSLYPFITLAVLGLMLIVIAIVKPLKESLKKIFFI